jgi:Tfp pilus assembly protein PilV
MRKKLNNAGDTIIEVVLAVTIASFVLAAAVVSTDSNLNSERQSENRSIAVQIVQSQIEELDSYYTSQTGAATSYIQATGGSTFCMNPAGSSGLTPEPVTATTTSNTCYFSESDVYLATPADIVAAGTPVFAVTISFNTNYITNNGLYQATVSASWTQTGIGHSNAVTIDYRLN